MYLPPAAPPRTITLSRHTPVASGCSVLLSWTASVPTKIVRCSSNAAIVDIAIDGHVVAFGDVDDVDDVDAWPILEPQHRIAICVLNPSPIACELSVELTAIDAPRTRT